MKRLHLLYLILLPLFTNGQIGAKTQQGKIYGVWQNDQFGYQMTLMLNADGSGEFDGDAITFTVQSSNLSLTQQGNTTSYTFLLQGNSLTLSGGDLESPVAFIRSGTSAASPAPATQTTAPAKSTIPVSTGKLIGVWSNYGETIEFSSNGQCTYLGQTYPYEVSGNHITLQTGQGSVLMAYSVSGEALTLTLNGKTLTYNKGKAGTAKNTQTSAGKGTVATELVGKWCYLNTLTNIGASSSNMTSSEQCITLNGDGSYEYYSERSMSTNTPGFYGGTNSQSGDRGQWWVQGDRIYYNSQTRGQGSYQIQKVNHPKNRDPMIVLDGDAYVTYYQKAPW